MNEKTKILIIGACPGAHEMAAISKTIAKQIGVTLIEFQKSFEEASIQMQKVSELQIEGIKNFAVAVSKMKSLGSGPSQKSKYINKPQHNFKSRGIPKKINNKR